jgi:predicted choloylglycine hydrolase
MSTDSATCLRYLEVSGTHFDVGVQLGRFGADIVHRHLSATQAWASVMARRDHPDVAWMRTLVESRFPEYWQELQGLAQGLALPFDDVFLWNCRGDLWALAPDGCTTVQIPGDVPVIAHNEDGDPGLRGHCAIVKVMPESSLSFTAFVYPASLPGHTFAVTQTGLVQTVNNIRSRDAGPGLPRMLLGRAVLDCASVEEAIRKLEGAERAGAFHMTLAQCSDARIVSVEFTHSTCSAITIDEPRCHSNHLVHPVTRNERQIVTGSSRSRQERGDTIVVGAGFESRDPLAVLWDKRDPALPVYREQLDDPDGEITLATAVFRIGKKSVRWDVYEHAGAPARRFEG